MNTVRGDRYGVFVHKVTSEATPYLALHKDCGGVVAIVENEPEFYQCLRCGERGCVPTVPAHYIDVTLRSISEHSADFRLKFWAADRLMVLLESICESLFSEAAA